jgi:hypothetical protein
MGQRGAAVATGHAVVEEEAHRRISAHSDLPRLEAEVSARDDGPY